MVQLFAMAASFFGSTKHSNDKQNDDHEEFHSTQSSATGTPDKSQIKATPYQSVKDNLQLNWQFKKDKDADDIRMSDLHSMLNVLGNNKLLEKE